MQMDWGEKKIWKRGAMYSKKKRQRAARDEEGRSELV